MYVTTRKLQSLGVSKSDIPTGFCRKSTFRTNFDAVMQKKGKAAVHAINDAIQTLVKSGVLPKESRTSACGMVIDDSKSYVLGYIEKENGKEYLVLQVGISLGTLDDPKGKITASIYRDDFSRQFVNDTLDNLEPVKGKIVEKLKEYRANYANVPRQDGTQEVSMEFAEGFF